MTRAIVSFLFAAAVLADSSGTTLVATTANVTGAPEQVRIEILRWSTEDERGKLVDVWNLKPAAGGGGAAKGKAGAAKGKGGGKGGPKGPSAGEPAAIAPETALARALEQAPTVGYLWSSENAGYALRYANQITNADGSKKIVLLTQRRLGARNQRWQPTYGTPNTDEFSLIELHLDAKGQGEGKASLTGKLAADVAGLGDYASVPTLFVNVHQESAQ